jgi:ubiquinone/menaquinone biosynthesis C-methylase UbiE
MTLPFAQMNFPEIYEQELVRPLFRPFAERILDYVELAPGDRVLDVACGTGIVSRLAREQVGEAGKVVGVDLSPPMLAVARKVAPEIDWREGDATSLPLHDDEEFDVAVCHQGLQFVPDKAAAASQMHRALTEGGRLAVATWRPDGELQLIPKLRRVAERHLGPITDMRHSFGETEPLESVLTDAGFRDVASRTLSRRVRFADASLFLRLNTMALVGMSPASKELAEDERGRIVDAIVREGSEVIAPFTDQNGLAFDMSTSVATGNR